MVNGREIFHQRFRKTMTFLRLTSIAGRRFGRFVLRASNCWQVVLAAAMLVSPCAGLLQGQEGELTESSTPVDEQEDCSEFLVTTRTAPTRRPLGRTTSELRLKRDSDGGTRHRATPLRPGRFVSGHRLANGLRAPLRC